MNALPGELLGAVQTLREAEIDGTKGLPEELFLLVSSLVPLPNVDLLVVNSKNQLLLSRRNDGFFEKSWHIPGGCMRYGETFEDRIQQTALREFGSVVQTDGIPISIKNVLRGENPSQKYPKERGHNVAVLFRCSLPAGYELRNGTKQEWENGYLKWFDSLPEDFMKIQYVYRDVLRLWMHKEDRYENMEK